MNRVVDGNTIDVTALACIRLADIDTPEIGRPGAQEATEYTTTLVDGRTVYLDVDDVYGTDIYDRVVAVVYDFPNEFDPSSWTLYVPYPSGSSPPPARPPRNRRQRRLHPPSRPPRRWTPTPRDARAPGRDT